MADRVLVMREGRLTGEFARARGDSRSRHVRGHGRRGGGADDRHRRTPVQPGRAPRRRSSSASRPRARRASCVALLLVILVATISNPTFLFSADGFRDLLLTPSLLLLVAVGSAIVIITRNVDLSVGSIVGLTAYLTGRLFIDIPGIPIIGVFVGGVLFGGCPGTHQRRAGGVRAVPALVITLGTLYIYRGINVAWAGSDRINASDLPANSGALGTDRILGIPILTIIAVVVLVVAAWYLRNLPQRPRAVRDRLRPRRRAPLRAAGHPSRDRRVRRQRRARGPRRRALRRPLRHRQLAAPASAGSCRRSAPR